MNNRMVSNVLWQFGERILAQLVSVIVTIVLARLLMPDDYGAVAMVTVFITVADVFVSDGIPNALIQKEHADECDFSTVFYFNVVFSVLLYAILFLASPFVAKYYGIDKLSAVLRVMGIKVLISALASVQHAFVARNMLFKIYFFSTLVGTLISGVTGVTMAYLGFGVWALVAQYLLNSFIDTCIVFSTIKWRPVRKFSTSRLRPLFKYGWKILFESLSNKIAAELRNLIIGKVYSSGDLAYYNRGTQFPNLIVSNVGTSVSAVLFPAMAEKQSDLEKVKELLRKSVRFTSYIIFPMLTGMAVIAEPLIRFLLTDKWVPTVPYLRIFCILSFATVGMYPRHQALNGTGRSDVFMIEHILARVASLILLLMVYRISVMAIALSSIGSTVILSATVMYTSKRFNRYAYLEQASDIFPSIGGCLFVAIGVFIIGRIISGSDLMIIIVSVVVGVSIYIVYSKIMHIEEFDVLIKMIKQYSGRIFGVKNGDI